MKLSTRSRYGVRVMVDLAQNFNKKPLQLSQIAKNENLSSKYLTHILHKLKEAGFVDTERGAYGGYFLKKPPEEITLKDIIEILENGIYLVFCVENKEKCNRSNNCIFNKLWTFLSQDLKDTLNKITLQRLCDMQSKGVFDFEQIIEK